eukprot:8069661-Lingulodinium_polyedra.AAC.1
MFCCKCGDIYLDSRRCELDISPRISTSPMCPDVERVVRSYQGMEERRVSKMEADRDRIEAYRCCAR